MRPTPISPMSVTGVRHLVERAYRESGELQYLRELVINSLEAGASRIEIGPEWDAVDQEGVYRLMVADNGVGMTPDQLLKFLNTFGGGGKPIGDAHENFGVGAKTSLLPWNHQGVIVLSWTAESQAGAMVWLMRDPVSGEYGAKKFETVDGSFEEVIVPPPEWSRCKPSWIGPHGTVVICLGNTGRENTFLGKTGDGDIKGISAYLNKRLWQLPTGVDLFVQELRTDKPSEWPRSLEEASGPAGRPDRRWNRRQIRGAAYFTEHVPAEAGKFETKGTYALSDGTKIDWYLWSGERPAVHSYAHKNGFIAALYKNELYDTKQHPSHYRSFGITHAAVRQNVTLIARPPATDGSYGVYPDTARNALKIQGTRRAGESLPWAEWAQEFAEHLPAALREALAKAAPASSGTLTDGSWRTRLLDRFGGRWRSLRFASDPTGTERVNPDETTGTRSNGTGSRGGDGNTTGPTTNASGTQKPTNPTLARRSSPAGTTAARNIQARGGLPDWEWTTMSEIDDAGAFGAAWCAPNPVNPNGLVQLARDFPAIVEVKNHWREQFADHLGDQVDQIVETVYGEAMVARVAHSEALVTHPLWGRAKLEAELRSPTALTMAMLGLLSEDHVISSRLTAALGRRRS